MASTPSRGELSSVWGALVDQLRSYDLSLVREDVLKPLYEQLVDPETRHDLGEYYTPDWLAEEVVEATLEPWLREGRLPRVLDPTCRSGSFLRAAIHRLRKAMDGDAASQLSQVLDQVAGMDVNPLAVTVAKANYLLAVSDLVATANFVIDLPIYLCNSLSAQERHETSSLFGETVDLRVGERDFAVPLELVLHGADYDRAISEVVSVAKSFAGTRQAPWLDPKSPSAAGVGRQLIA